MKLFDKHFSSKHSDIFRSLSTISGVFFFVFTIWKRMQMFIFVDPQIWWYSFSCDYLCRMWKYFSVLCVGSTHSWPFKSSKMNLMRNPANRDLTNFDKNKEWLNVENLTDFLEFLIKNKHWNATKRNEEWKKYVSLKFYTSFVWIHNRLVATSALPSEFILKFKCRTEKFEMKKKITALTLTVLRWWKSVCDFDFLARENFFEILTVLHRRHYEQDWTKISGDRLDFARELWCVRENRNGLIINMSEHVLWNMLWYAKGAIRQERERRKKRQSQRKCDKSTWEYLVGEKKKKTNAYDSKREYK